jgi:hypothetical protein
VGIQKWEFATITLAQVVGHMPTDEKSMRRLAVNTLPFRQEEIISSLFKSMPSAVLKNPREMVHPVAKNVMHVIKMRPFHADPIRSSMSSFEANSRSLRILFNKSKRQKSHGLTSGE